MHGGVYVPVTAETPPNPYLKHVPERDIATPSGRELTLVNPAYMTRQVHELGKETEGVRAHITSLDPIRPQNAADPWETEALQAFEVGAQEIHSVETLDGHAHLRLMRPLITEQGCMKCHAAQGYEVGNVRGGISISVPMAPYNEIAYANMGNLGLAHAGLWLLGLAGIGWGYRRVAHHAAQQRYAEEQREAVIGDLQQALDEIKTLSGIIPICSHCKSIRDDKGYWQRVEDFVHKNAGAKFSHGLCPECLQRYYPEEAAAILANRQLAEN